MNELNNRLEDRQSLMSQLQFFSFNQGISIDEDIVKFKNREVKAKEIFTIREINKKIGYEFIKQ